MPEFPFVAAGRLPQLEIWHRAFAAALAGQPQVLLLAGRAGTGKTRFVAEVARRARVAEPRLVVAQAQCSSPFGVGDPYLPIKAILAQLTGDVEEDVAAGRLTEEGASRLRRAAGHSIEAIAELGPDLVGIFLPPAGFLLRAGVYLSEKKGWLAGLRQRTLGPAPKLQAFEAVQFFEQFSRVLERLAAAAPLLLVLEDLHWADAGTLELLFYVARRIAGKAGLPLLLLGTYRPGEVALGRGGQPHPLARILDELRGLWPVGGLDLSTAVGGAAGRAFVEALLEARPNRLEPAFRQQLVERTGGHPLFVAEMLRWLEAQAVLAVDGQGRWVLAREVDWARMPERIEALLRLRVARLPAELQKILSCASAEGEQFTFEVVARVRQIDRLRLAEALDGDLGRVHALVAADGEVAAPGAALSRYRFLHALFHHYVYGRLGPGQKRELHRAIGEALEALFGEQADTIAAHLARHFEQAGEAGKAVGYAATAAEAAMAAWSVDDAIVRYHWARGLLARLPGASPEREYRIAQGLARAHGLRGEPQAERAEIDRMLERAEALGDVGKQAESRTALATHLARQSRFAEARATGLVALAEAERSGDPARQAAACLAVADACAFLAEHAAAMGHLERALAIYRARADSAAQAEAIGRLALVHLNRNEYRAALQHAEAALALFRAAGDRVGEERILRYVGDIRAGEGDYEQALDCYREVLAIRRAIGHRAREGGALGDLGDIYLAVGRYEESLDLHRQSLAIDREVGYRYGEAWCHHDLGRIWADLGELPKARQELLVAHALACEIEAKNLVVLSLLGLSLTCRLLGGEANLGEALRLASEASELGRRWALPYGVTVGEAYQAGVHLARGGLQDALFHSHSAVAAVERHGKTELNDEEVLFIHHQVLSAAGDRAAARQALARAYRGVMGRAERIRSDELRQSFLSRVPFNRRCVAAWQEQLAGDQRGSGVRNG
jgi:predicted ATPase